MTHSRAHVRRLAIDLIGRIRLIYAGAAVCFAFTALLASRARQDGVVFLTAPGVTAFSLAASWLLAHQPMSLLDQREVVRLPVSRRDLWLAKWWLGALVAPLAIGAMAVAVLAVAAPAQIAFAEVVLIPLFGVLYCGGFMTLNAWWPIPPVEASSAAAVTQWLVMFLVRFLGGIGLPFLFARSLPYSAAQVTPAWAAGLAIAAAIFAAGYLYPAPVVARASRPVFQGRTRTQRSWWPGNRLSGVSRLMWVHGREIFLVSPFLCGLLLFSISTDSAATHTGLRELFHRAQLLPFDRAYGFDGPHGINVLFMVWLLIGHSAQEIFRRTRALRVLPLSSMGLSLIVASLGIVSAIVMWAWLFAIHCWIVHAIPTSLRPDLFILLAGAVACTQALDRVVPFGGRALSGIALISLAVLADQVIPALPIALSVAGIALFATAVLVLSWLLKTRSGLYKFKPQTIFGMTMPQ